MKRRANPRQGQLPIQAEKSERSTKLAGPRPGLEVDCLNCHAKFIAWYGPDEDDIETAQVNACGNQDQSNDDALMISPAAWPGATAKGTGAGGRGSLSTGAG